MCDCLCEVSDVASTGDRYMDIYLCMFELIGRDGPRTSPLAKTARPSDPD